MLAAQQAKPPPAGRVRHQLVDGEHPAGLPGGYDLICSSLAVQWFGDLDAGLARLAGLLAPGGLLAIATLAEHTFSEWRAAHQAHGLHAATPAYPPAERIGRTLAGLRGGITREAYRQRHPDALHFVRSLKAIGATAPAAGHAPLSPAAFRRVLAQFDRQGNHVTYDLAYGLWRKQALACSSPAPIPASARPWPRPSSRALGEPITGSRCRRAWPKNRAIPKPWPRWPGWSRPACTRRPMSCRRRCRPGRPRRSRASRSMRRPSRRRRSTAPW